MNPLVRVSAAPGSPQLRLLDPAFLSTFDLVVAVGQPPYVVRRADALCVQRGVKFMAAAVRGTGSFYLVDLGSHAFKPKARFRLYMLGGACCLLIHGLYMVCQPIVAVSL